MQGTQKFGLTQGFWLPNTVIFVFSEKNEGPRALSFSMKIHVYTYVHKTSFTS